MHPSRRLRAPFLMAVDGSWTDVDGFFKNLSSGKGCRARVCKVVDGLDGFSTSFHRPQEVLFYKYYFTMVYIFNNLSNPSTILANP